MYVYAYCPLLVIFENPELKPPFCLCLIRLSNKKVYLFLYVYFCDVYLFNLYSRDIQYHLKILINTYNNL